MDQILNADDAHLAQLPLDDLVGSDGSAITIDLDKPTLVDQVTHGLQVGAAVGNVGLADPEHVGGGLIHLDEDAVVDLPQSEELENPPDLGRHLVDTTDPHDESQLGLSGDIVVTVLLGITLEPDLILLLVLVLLHVLLGTLEDVDTLLPPIDLSLDGELGPVRSLPLATLENSLWDCGEFSVRHSSLVEVNQ